MWDFRQLQWLNYAGWWPYACQTRYGFRISRIMGSAMNHHYDLLIPLDIVEWRSFSLVTDNGVLGLCLYFSNVVQIGPELVSLYLEISEGSLKGTVLNLTSTLVGIQSAIKVGAILLCHKRIASIVNGLKDVHEEAAKALGTEAVAKGEGREVYCRLSAMFVKVVMVGVGHWTLRPLYLITQGEKVLVIEAWIPGDLEDWRVWSAVWVAQTLHVYSAMFGFFVFDSICYSALASLLQLSDILKAGLASLKPPDGSVMPCVRLHNHIFRLAGELDDLIKYILLIQYIFITLVFCLSVFELSSVEGTTLVKTMNLFELIFNMSYVVFFYSFLCQQLEDINTEVLRSAYESGWYQGSSADKRSLGILMEVAKRPYRFGLIVGYNLQAFIAILQTSFTYFNFLKAMTEEEPSSS